MMKLGNKGQSLVLFVLLIPIMLCILVLVIDCGACMLEKQELDHVNKIVIRYGLRHMDDDVVEKKMIDLFDLNLQDVSVQVNVKDNVIYIDSTKYVQGVFCRIFNIDGFQIVSSYSGTIKEDKILIKKS